MKKKLLRVLAIILTVIILLTCVTSAVYGWSWPVPTWKFKSNWLEMNYYCGSGEDGCWCGPSSGVSIGRFYRDWKDYGNLPDSDSTMYDALHEYMNTAPTGYTSPSNYGPGFVEMALHYEYDNFSYVHYGPDSEEGPVDEDFFWVIEEAIDNGWPVALFAMGPLQGFEDVEAISTDEPQPPIDWPCEVWHVIAIEGYSYWEYSWPWGYVMDTDHLRIRCTDNYSNANTLWLSWDDFIAEVPEHHREAVIIKNVGSNENDGLVESFEWGSDGTSLDTSGGEVEWDIATPGYSVVEIDTAQKHSGTRSARFYKWIAGPYAHYSLLQPSYIGFWLKKDDTAAYFEVRHGDGSRAIRVQVNSAEQLRYYDGSWHTVHPIASNAWYHIEFKNINWAGGTYDIHVDGYCPSAGSGAGMQITSLWEGEIWFGSWGGDSGEFWIDDIKDSMVQP